MELFDTILLVGIVQGVFLTAGLLVKNYGKKKQNFYFFALLVLVSLALLSKFLYTPEKYQEGPHIWFIADLVAYLIGPLWYFTIKKSILPKVQLSLRDWVLLAPMLYHIGFIVFIYNLSNEELLAAGVTKWFNSSFYIFCSTVLLVNGAFLWEAHQILRKHRDAQFPELLIKGQYAFLFILVIWIGSFMGSFLWSNRYMINFTAYRYAFVSLSFLTFSLAFLALIRPASFYFLTQTYDSGETFILQEIADKALQFLQEKEPFLQRNYSLHEFSTAIQSNPVLTSKAINRILKTTYTDLMNEYRVRYFLKMAQDKRRQNLTHWAIAQEAGFGNKVSFYKAFKKLMGTTPKVYLAALSKK